MIPILIIGHARPDHLARTIQSILQSECKILYFSIDGPRDHVMGERARVDECKMIVKNLAQFNNLEIRYIFHAENLGSAANVIGSIDWAFNEEDKLIVLEDDCVPDSSFYSYMNHAINYIASKKQFWIASGFRPIIAGIENNESYVTHAPMTWGWGTTYEKWHQIRSSIFEDSLADSLWRTFIFRNDQVFWKIGALRAVKGWADFWDVPVAYGMKYRNQLSLIPPKNLISNIGTGEDATNTIQNSIFLNSKVEYWSGHEIELSKKNLDTNRIQHYDLLINKQMHQIRKRHKLLPIIKFCYQYFFKFRKKDKISLKDRVQYFYDSIESNIL